MIVDRVGRRIVLLVGFAGCLFCLVIETIMVALYAGTDNIAGQNTGVAFMYIFLAFYAIGVDVGIYVVAGELFPGHHRTKGVALMLACMNATSTIYLTTATIAFEALQWKFFLVSAQYKVPRPFSR